MSESARTRKAPAAAGAAPLRVLRPSPFGLGTGVLRLQTLVRLRWLAVAGQLAAVLGVHFGLGFPLDLGPCLAVIAVSAWLNIFLSLRYPANQRLRDRYAALLLAYDILQLAALIYLTGGLENPFSFMFLVPATISASHLKPKNTLALAALTLVCITALARFHQPLPWRPGEALMLPPLYVVGMWAALVCGLAFMGVYAFRSALEARRMSKALAAADLVLAQARQLSALDGLAAAAAHELGTPLATIALVVKELARELPADGAVAEDLELLRSQTERCREILSRLAVERGGPDRIMERAPLTALIEEVADNYRRPGVEIAVHGRGAAGSEPEVLRDPAVRHGLANLIANAADFAEARVDIAAGWDEAGLTVSIEDDGPGFPADILDKLGEPYVTARKRAAPASADEHDVAAHAPGEGMGLGFFIAKTLLERTGATLTLANRPRPGHGAVVRIAWPRGTIEPPP